MNCYDHELILNRYKSVIILIHLRSTFGKLKTYSSTFHTMTFLVMFLMSYSVVENDAAADSDAESDISCEEGKPVAEYAASPGARIETATLLDLYSGCGAMSTGLFLGAELAGIKLKTVCFVIWMP